MATAASLIAGGCERSRSALTDDRPPPRHLVLITLDTTRADSLGSYGNFRDISPTLDALARRGVIFEDAISQSISTPPSHASMMTGKNPPRHGLRLLSGETLSPVQVTLAEVLSAHGFVTAAFVSGLPLHRAVGVDQGFAIYDEVPEGYTERNAADTNARVRDWLATAPSAPTFLWVHYFDPHAPYLAPAKYQVRFAGREFASTDLVAQTNVNRWTADVNRWPGDPTVAPSPEQTAEMKSLYEAEVRHMDDRIAELFEMLDTAGILETAIVAIVADHGEGFGENGYYFAHWDVFGENARVPLILAHPDGLFRERRVTQTVRTIDIMPTVLRWLAIPLAVDVDGKDLTPLIEGNETASRESYTEQVEWFDARAVRTEKWLFVQRNEKTASGEKERRSRLYYRGHGQANEEDVSALHPTDVERLAQRLLVLAEPQDAGISERHQVSEDTTKKLQALGYLQ